MNNAEKFQEVFGYYATEMWAKTEAEFLDWINEEHNDRTGEWIEIPQSDFWKCSCCGDIDFPRDFCPNCGAKMGGDE